MKLFKNNGSRYLDIVLEASKSERLPAEKIVSFPQNLPARGGRKWKLSWFREKNGPITSPLGRLSLLMDLKKICGSGQEGNLTPGASVAFWHVPGGRETVVQMSKFEVRQQESRTSVLGFQRVVFRSEDRKGYTKDLFVECRTASNGGVRPVRSLRAPREQQMRRRKKRRHGSPALFGDSWVEKVMRCSTWKSQYSKKRAEEKEGRIPLHGGEMDTEGLSEELQELLRYRHDGTCEVLKWVSDVQWHSFRGLAKVCKNGGLGNENMPEWTRKSIASIWKQVLAEAETRNTDVQSIMQKKH